MNNKQSSRALLTALALSMSLSIGMQKAQAVDADSWNSLRNAIVNGTDPTINITEDINRRLVDSNQMGNISNAITEITINGNCHSLEGFTQHKRGYKSYNYSGRSDFKHK